MAGWLRHLRADMVGGLVSAAIAIPLAMGYGMFAFTSLGENYFADGAIAGLTTALVVAIVCVVLGDKTTTRLRTADQHDFLSRHPDLRLGSFR